jgi:hypothetical protein
LELALYCLHHQLLKKYDQEMDAQTVNGAASESEAPDMARAKG